MIIVNLRKPGKSPYSVRIQENTDQKKLRIWTLSPSAGVFSAKQMKVAKIHVFF